MTSPAAKALRDSTRELTEGERVQTWWATDEGGLSWWVKAGGISIANAGQGATAETAARHIALTASPDVVTALADLLDALHAIRGQHFVEDEDVRRFEGARDALETAVMRNAT